MKLTGNTLIFGTVADPVAHVTSPERFSRLFEKWRVDAVMLAFHVKPGDLERFVEGVRGVVNLAGFCVTVPHKRAILPLLDSVSDRAALVGASNVVRREIDGRLVGDQMDGLGFVEGLKRQGHAVAGREIFMAGAGGAASGIGFALAAARAKRLTIHNRTESAAQALADRIRAAEPNCVVDVGGPDPAGHSIVINATSAGMHDGDDLPMKVEGISPGMVVAEVIMRPRQTTLLKEAERRGATLHYGDEMLFAQLPLLAEFMGAIRDEPEDQRTV